MHTMVGMNTQELIQTIDTRIEALTAEMARLSDARKGLLDAHAAATRPRAKTGLTRRRTRREKRAGRDEVLVADLAVRMLTESDGLTTSALAKQANADPRQVLPLLKELEGAGSVRRTGERRATRWHVITDEDRIKERAAELAARRKRT